MPVAVFPSATGIHQGGTVTAPTCVRILCCRQIGRSNVQLVNKHPAATYYLTQAAHHRTAIDAAVGYVAEFARSRPEQTDDIVSSEFWSIERDWVIETIYQGAYLRQYHLWEKNCKEYFSSQGAPIPKTGRQGFTECVEQVLLSHFHIDVPQDVMAALSTVRSKVNNMKHEEGVQTEEFVSADDYVTAVATIERFWEFLEKNEALSPNPFPPPASPPRRTGSSS
jgi:hypothetical protein